MVPVGMMSADEIADMVVRLQEVGVEIDVSDLLPAPRKASGTDLHATSSSLGPIAREAWGRLWLPLLLALAAVAIVLALVTWR